MQFLIGIGTEVGNNLRGAGNALIDFFNPNKAILPIAGPGGPGYNHPDLLDKTKKVIETIAQTGGNLIELGQKAWEGDGQAAGMLTTQAIMFGVFRRGGAKRLSSKKLATQIRNGAGSAGGLGTKIKGSWLKGSEGQAGAFPKSIAKQLRGQTFNSFKDFRSAFWEAVGNDPKLSSQFSSQNVALMRNGQAPFAVPSQHYRGARRYQLHHKKPINKGGVLMIWII